MNAYPKHCRFSGRLLMIGFGSIGQGVLPLILRHIDMPRENIKIITAEHKGAEIAGEYGIGFICSPVTRENYHRLIGGELEEGDILLNLSVDVSSVALMELCQRQGALYLDTCVEPWEGGYTDASLSPSLRSNYALRHDAISKRAQFAGGPTALFTHGANPGLVSHFVKQALLNIAEDTGLTVATPASRADWAALSQKLGIKTIHIAERDTQVSNVPKRIGEFVNTWSVDGFVSEGSQPAELGWGTHEAHFPADGIRHDFYNGCGIILNRPGASVRVRTWTPQEGHFHGFLITHNEALSIADYLTVEENGQAVYRPTCHYAYHPCDDAVKSVHEFAGKNWVLQKSKRILRDEILPGGIDELGVLLAGHGKNAYWFGSQLSIDEARQLVPYNTATSLQVTVSVLGGLVWAMENPKAGIVESDDIDFQRVLEICMPYLGPVVGAYTDWTPLTGRNRLFQEDIDMSDPWQFKNVRVI